MSVNGLSPRTINSSRGGSVAGSEAEAEVLLLRTQLHQNILIDGSTDLSGARVVDLGALAKNDKSLTGYQRSNRGTGLRAELNGAAESDVLLVGTDRETGKKQKPKTRWSGFLMIPMYVAYAILLKLQSHLRSHLHISSGVLASTYTEVIMGGSGGGEVDHHHHHLSQNLSSNNIMSSTSGSGGTGGTMHQGALLENGAASQAAYIFGLSVSFYYLGCFTFRVGHNVLLGWKLKITPRSRVLVGYCGMSFVLITVVSLFFGVFPSEAVGWTSTPQAVHDHPGCLIVVLLCYYLAGCSMATFEPNVLSTLTAHGPKDKVLAIGAIPLATNTLACGTLFALGLAHTASRTMEVEMGMYITGAALCLAGALVFQLKIPHIPFEATEDDAAKFWTNVKRWREWVFGVKWLFIASFLDECTLSCSVGIGQYIYGVKQVPMLAPFLDKDDPNQHFLDHDYFLVIFFFCGFLGGTISRFLTYDFKLRNPVVYLLINLMGIACILSKTPIFAPIGMFCIMYGNGCIYATIARTIDEEIGWEFNLVAYSFVACVADIGGFTGANLVVPLHATLGSVGSGGPF